MPDEITIKVLKYDELFTKRSKDLSKVHWFSMPVDLLLHPDFFGITGDEFKAFIWVVSLAAKYRSDTVRLDMAHAQHLLSLDRPVFLKMLSRLEGKQVFTELRPHHGRTEAALRPLHNITEHNITPQKPVAWRPSDESLDLVYKKYPRKEGKSRGFTKLKAQLKSESDLLDFEKSITNYLASCKRLGTEAKYIKQFSTFVGEWRDWLDASTGSSTGFESSKNKTIKIEGW